MSCHRAIKTTQEIRANQDGQWVKGDFDFMVKIRGRRRNIPNSWDDIMRTDWSHRCWKRHRHTQYHVIEMK